MTKSKLMGIDFTRRNFLQLAGGVCLSVVGLGVVGCSPTNLSDTSEEEAESFDVIVIGAGGSGLAAAMTAAERGKSVLVLESIAQTGGAFSVGEAATPITVNDSDRFLSPDGLFDYWYESAERESNGPLLRKVAANASDTIAWLEGHGLKLYDIVYDAELNPKIPVDFPISLKTSNPDGQQVNGGGKPFTDLMLAKAEEFGAKVLTNCAATDLLVDDSGAVMGVKVDGHPSQYLGSKVIIASGGFGAGAGEEGNEVIEKFAPHLLRKNIISFDYGGSDGSGIAMADRIGAQTKFVGTCAHGNLRCSADDQYPRKNTVIIDEHGRRFASEAAKPTPFFAACIENGSEAFWEITDADTAISDVAASLGEGTTQQADSLAELATAIGVETGSLEGTIADYNDMAEAGEDTLFQKSADNLVALTAAPFYANETYIRLVHTIGGIIVDENTRVLGTDGSPIPNLYAVGDCANSNFHYKVYLGTGSGTCWALNTGRIAALDAVEQLSA